jgi:type IV secretory pathway TraG/TraD family ATPase VirD4
MLKSALTRAPVELQGRAGPYISNLNRDQQSAVSGLQSRLALVAESSVGEFLQPGEPIIDLRHTLSESNEVVVFSLNSSRYGKLAAQLAAMIIQDLTTISGYRLAQPHRPLGFIAIDEFSALDADNLLSLLARAREAGISVLLSTQEMADLERLATGFKDQVLGNTAVVLAHRQNVPDSAELIAKMVGTDTVWKHTYQTGPSGFYGAMTGKRDRVTGMGTKRQVEEFRIHPNTIKELPTGGAVLITKIPKANAQLLRVDPWRPPRAGAVDAH